MWQRRKPLKLKSQKRKIEKSRQETICLRVGPSTNLSFAKKNKRGGGKFVQARNRGVLLSANTKKFKNPP